MIDRVTAIVTALLVAHLPLACAEAGAVPLVVLDTDETIDERDPAAVVRVDAADGITLRYPLEETDQASCTVLCTVTLRRAAIPSLVDATPQVMRRAAYRCGEAMARALVVGFEANAGGIEAHGVFVRTPTELTINEPDTDIEASVTSLTLSAVCAVDARWILARS
jgi:hypothetical protein